MRTRTTALLIAIAVLLVAALSGCGSSSSSSGSNPASVAPQSSFLYVDATIDPTGAQERNVRSILADLPGSGDPSQRLHQLFEKATRTDKTSKVDYLKDIKPWLGDRAALFVAPPAAGTKSFPYAIVVASTDTGATQRAIDKDTGEKRSYRGVDYKWDQKNADAEAVVGGFFVNGSEAGVKAAIDASKSAGLDQADRYKQTIAGLSGERIGFIYEDSAGLLGAITRQAEGKLGPLAPLLSGLLGGKPTVATIRAENQALVIDGPVIPLPDAFKGIFAGTPLMGSVPADSWLAFGVPDLGTKIKSFVNVFAGALGGEQKLRDQIRQATGLDLNHDLLDWIGDVAVFVQGESKPALGGGVLIHSKDPSASKQALAKIAALAGAKGGMTVAGATVGGASGYKLTDPSLHQPIYLVQGADTVAATYGEAAARAAFGRSTLSGDAGFKGASTALGSGYTPVLYVTAAPILRLVDSLAAGKSKSYREARPYLSALDYLIIGHGSSAGRIRLGFKPSG